MRSPPASTPTVIDHLRPFVLALLAAAALGTSVPHATAEQQATGDPISELGSDIQRVRERAVRRLRTRGELDPDALRAGLRRLPSDGRALLLDVVGTRGVAELVPDTARALLDPDPVVWGAAARALVRLGDDAVERGARLLDGPRVGAGEDGAAGGSAAAAAGLSEAQVALRHRRVRALRVQRVVESELMGRWMRKGGRYDGRFAVLGRHGWDAQPVLLAMLLDVPLEDRFVVLPELPEGPGLRLAQLDALVAVASSPRRGYRTFEELPLEVDEEELFQLATQALTDVADIELMGDLLDHVAEILMRAHERAGWQLRPVEKGYAEAIEEILAARGRPERLERRVRELELSARRLKTWADRASAMRRADMLQRYTTELADLAHAQYRMRRYDDAAATYAESIEITASIAGTPSPVTVYNRSCALAMGGARRRRWTSSSARCRFRWPTRT